MSDKDDQQQEGQVGKKTEDSATSGTGPANNDPEVVIAPGPDPKSGTLDYLQMGDAVPAPKADELDHPTGHSEGGVVYETTGRRRAGRLPSG